MYTVYYYAVGFRASSSKMHALYTCTAVTEQVISTSSSMYELVCAYRSATKSMCMIPSVGTVQGTPSGVAKNPFGLLEMHINNTS